jgi:hypothetical protein
MLAAKSYEIITIMNDPRIIAALVSLASVLATFMVTVIFTLRNRRLQR